MGECTFENTLPLLDEIERRLKVAGKWVAPPTHEEIEAQRRKHFDERAARGYLLRGEQFKEVPALPSNATGLDILKWASELGCVLLMQYNVAAEVLNDQRERQLSGPREEARALLRRDLRSGDWVAVVQMERGLSAPVSREFWDGTKAQEWLRTGKSELGPIRVAKSSATRIETPVPGDGGRVRAREWLLQNFPIRRGKARTKKLCFQDAGIQFLGLTARAFNGAWSEVSSMHPDWGMSKAGARKRN